MNIREIAERLQQDLVESHREKLKRTVESYRHAAARALSRRYFVICSRAKPGQRT
jgi:hypothetical protein